MYGVPERKLWFQFSRSAPSMFSLAMWTMPAAARSTRIWSAFQRAVTVDGLSVDDVVRSISANPARLLGLYDRVGSLDPGKDADLVVLDADFVLKGVMRRGEWIIEPRIG